MSHARKDYLQPGGYRYVSIRVGGRGVCGNRSCAGLDCAPRSNPEGMVINHLDGNKANNALSDLELTIHSGNAKHAWKQGAGSVGRGGKLKLRSRSLPMGSRLGNCPADRRFILSRLIGDQG